MNEEIKEILECLKEEDNYWSKQEHNYAFPDYYSLNREDLHLLLDYITNLQEENQKLNKIIDELEKWLKERINRYEYSTGNMNIAAAGTLKATLNKLTELKKEVE